eukprot:gnl/TRDRNA2_/TRDRNA2_82380_c0_seq1.p2 gnl/TRDRNA2_/TRDRNA2_82380_c0~~gnl/TRDRNA2_/TRDRNA2_82380_c0_seq1.p2  ORF type:complete len:210 (+),score=28.00 gnl/TRDRNA2_/TRDRNA2_82380_c0_seq1:78-707(+)
MTMRSISVMVACAGLMPGNCQPFNGGMIMLGGGGAFGTHALLGQAHDYSAQQGKNFSLLTESINQYSKGLLTAAVGCGLAFNQAGPGQREEAVVLEIVSKCCGVLGCGAAFWGAGSEHLRLKGEEKARQEAIKKAAERKAIKNREYLIWGNDDEEEQPRPTKTRSLALSQTLGATSLPAAVLVGLGVTMGLLCFRHVSRVVADNPLLEA